MRQKLIVLCLALCAATSAHAQVSVGIGLPNVSIGINLPVYPDLVRVPGYPVYYAPRMNANFFFYDGMYWVFQDDDWYASSWYNGPWNRVGPDYVPLYILRVPVRYYRQPPRYFRDWQRDAPPRWGDHWGRDWSQHRSGWDRWNHRNAPLPAPLPTYQRHYSGDRYPGADQQHDLRGQHYRYQPKDPVVRQNFEMQRQQDSRDGDHRERQNPRDERRNLDRPTAPEVRHSAPALPPAGEPRQRPDRGARDEQAQPRDHREARPPEAPNAQPSQAREYAPPGQPQGGPPERSGEPPRDKGNGRDRHDKDPRGDDRNPDQSR